MGIFSLEFLSASVLSVFSKRAQRYEDLLLIRQLKSKISITPGSKGFHKGMGRLVKQGLTREQRSIFKWFVHQNKVRAEFGASLSDEFRSLENIITLGPDGEHQLHNLAASLTEEIGHAYDHAQNPLLSVITNANYNNLARFYIELLAKLRISKDPRLGIAQMLSNYHLMWQVYGPPVDMKRIISATTVEEIMDTVSHLNPKQVLRDARRNALEYLQVVHEGYVPGILNTTYNPNRGPIVDLPSDWEFWEDPSHFVR